MAMSNDEPTMDLADESGRPYARANSDEPTPWVEQFLANGDQPRTAKSKAAFLAHYRVTGNVTRSAQAAGIHRQRFYDWSRDDRVFEDAAKAAAEESTELLEEEARRRAADGTVRERPVVYRGKVVATEVIREFSDGLLMFILRSRRPDKYGQKVDVTSGGEVVKYYRNVDIERV